MQKSIEEASVVELQAACYQLMCQIQQLNGHLAAIERELAERVEPEESQQATKETPKETPKKTTRKVSKS